MVADQQEFPAVMRALALAALLLAPLPALAQPAPPPSPPAPTVTLTLQEVDGLIQSLAEAPAKHTLLPLNFLLEKRQRAVPGGQPTEPKAP